MSAPKLLVTLPELQGFFNDLPPNGHPDRTLKLPVLLADESMTYLEFAWDHLLEQWQLSADGLIITARPQHLP